MLELVPPGLRVDFIGKAKIWMSISVVVILIGIASIVWRGGVNQGIDFSGGTLLQLRFSQPADLSMVREALGTLGLERSIVQHYGETHEVLIRGWHIDAVAVRPEQHMVGHTGFVSVARLICAAPEAGRQVRPA